MRTCFAAIGGAGAKAARALVYCALAGAVTADTVEVLLIDTDQRDEETVALFARYDRVRPLLPQERPRLICRRWPEHPLKADSLADLAQTPEDQLLLRALMPEADKRPAGAEGFRGQADSAALALAGLLGSGNVQPDGALGAWLTALTAEEARMVLCGSAMGGMGAAGLTALTECFRERLPMARIAAVALLPYFRASEDAMARAASALRQWSEDGLCDAVYLLGLEQSAYATVTEGCREARLPEWLAALCGADFFRENRQGCFSWRLPLGSLTWEAFGTESERCRLGFGRLTQTAAALRLDMGETIRRGLAEPHWLRDRLIPWYAGCFGGIRRWPEERRLALAEDYAQLTALLASYERWMGEVIATLPPALRSGSAMDEAARQAEENYRQLAQTAAQLTVMRQEAEADEWDRQAIQRGKSAAEEDEVRLALTRLSDLLSQLKETQRALVERIGGQAYLAMLKGCVRRFRQEADQFRGQFEEAEAHIRRAENDGSPEAAGRIASARAKLKRMERSLLLLEARYQQAESDLRAAGAENVRAVPPTVQDTAGAAACGLFEPAVWSARDQRQLERVWHFAGPGLEGVTLARRREELARLDMGDEPLRAFVRVMLNGMEGKA